jgi:hypothetical protein
MAWTTPLTAVANAPLTAAQWNASVRDNLNETAPAKAATAGSIFVATGLNAIAQRTPAFSFETASETTASTSYTNLATAGPSVGPLTTGTKALIIISSLLSNNTAGQNCLVGVDVSGSSAISASDAKALRYESGNAADTMQASYVYLEDTLVAGSNTFTAKYRVTGGTGTFDDRRLSVIPF